ncbi:hypothetical protein TNCV_576541 [Trichonephila clavipes]|nr:hypothetical protein TNCV_576541 [Trichonephila clavipes]
MGILLQSLVAITEVAVVAEWSRYRIVDGLVTISSPVPLKTRRGLGSNPGEDMDVCKCIVSLRYGDTLNSRRAANRLVRLVAGDERWEASDPPPGYSPSKLGCNLDKSYCHLILGSPRCGSVRYPTNGHRSPEVIVESWVKALASLTIRHLERMLHAKSIEAKIHHVRPAQVSSLLPAVKNYEVIRQKPS